MLLPRKWRPFVFILAVACVVPSLSAVIAETREYHGKKVTCLQSGIFSSSGMVCGTQHYARVFTGTVQSAVEVGDTDKRLQLVQDEVFLGDSASKRELASRPDHVDELMEDIIRSINGIRRSPKKLRG